MKPSRAILIALGTGGVIGLLRFIYECCFVVPLVPDPQSPIWIMFSAVTSVFIALTLGLTTLFAIRGHQTKSTISLIVGSMAFLILLGWFSTGFLNLHQMRAALLDSADPYTDPDRLRALADFKNGPGYEIDNRIAQHPNTPPDVLRLLHGRPNQVGTEMCLAQNPNTPDDILIGINNRSDEWREYLQDALKQNPRYNELFTHDR